MSGVGRTIPAVSVPVGDFFGAILGRPVAFENELFANPEGRSFNCYIPMPFRTAARVTVTNESTRHIAHFFYDIDTLALDKPDSDSLYFHASWRRERWTTLGRDFELLPQVRGELSRSLECGLTSKTNHFMVRYACEVAI